MSLALVRVDDRLLHGQVVVGWVRALGAKRIVVVDDTVVANEWERELYQLGVPSGLDVRFVSVDEAPEALDRAGRDREATIVLVPDVHTLMRLCRGTSIVQRVNLGGLHDDAGRTQRLSYVYLSGEEAACLQQLEEEEGVRITAQDVPTARAVSLGELL